MPEAETEWKWLASTRELQETSYGVDYDALEGDALADYVTWNVTALISEVGEFLNEIGWKNWAHPRGWVNRDQAIGELVDAEHFIANLYNVLNVTDEEREQRYRAKQLTNAKRQADGYDGVAGKCRACHRDLNEIGIKADLVDGDVVRWCQGCGAVVL